MTGTAAAGACGTGSPPSADLGSEAARQITSRFGLMADETREAALERLDVQMAYLRERVEAMMAEIHAAEREGVRLAHMMGRWLGHLTINGPPLAQCKVNVHFAT